MSIRFSQLCMAAAMAFTGAILPAAAQQAAAPAAPPQPQFLLSSGGFNDGADIPGEYFCAAKPIFVSPALGWTNVPKGTASFTLIFHDPDAHPQKGMSDVTHWIVWN